MQFLQKANNLFRNILFITPATVRRGHSSRRIFKNKKNVRTDGPDKKYFGRMYITSSFSTRWICFYIQEISILTRNPRSMTKEPLGRRRLCRNPKNGSGSTTPLLVQCFDKGRQELLLAGNDIFQDDMLVAVRDVKGFLGQKISVQTAAEKFRRGFYDISHHHEHHI